MKPEPELLLVLTGGLGGLIPTKLNFSNLFCAGKTTDLSLSPCLSKSLSFRYHIYSWKQQHQVPHQVWLCFHCSGNGTHVKNCKLNLKSPLLSLPHCCQSEYASICHLFSSKAGLRSFHFLASGSHMSLKVSQNRNLGGFQ